MTITARQLAACVAIACALSAALGASVALLWSERRLSRMARDVATTSTEVSVMRTYGGLVIKAAEASLESCIDAMPPTVAAQRRAMIEEVRRQTKAPTGVGGE